MYPSYSDLPFFVVETQSPKRRTKTSCGIILKSKKTNRQLLVSPRETHSFVLFLRGVYHLSKIPFMVSNLTLREYETLKGCLENEEEFKRVFLMVNGEDNKHVRRYSYKRLLDAKPIFLSLPVPTKLHTEFTPSKGQKVKGESDLECAYREFLEETGINLQEFPHEIITTKDEVITTHSGLHYENRYFVVEVDDEIDVPNTQDSNEVHQVMWM